MKKILLGLFALSAASMASTLPLPYLNVRIGGLKDGCLFFYVIN